jgi:hypothetical protein
LGLPHTRDMNCKSCGLDHSPLVRCEVHKRIAINGAINASAINSVAINAEVSASNVGEVSKVEMDSPVSVRTPNRRDRKAYNEYMREYMRTHRPRKKNPT